MNSIETSMLFILKKNEKLRLCVDYRDLNKIIRKNRHLLSLIIQMLNQLKKGLNSTTFLWIPQHFSSNISTSFIEYVDILHRKILRWRSKRARLFRSDNHLSRSKQATEKIFFSRHISKFSHHRTFRIFIFFALSSSCLSHSSKIDKSLNH
jgi:uncharacterized protein YeeX (DUF496 family)